MANGSARRPYDREYALAACEAMYCGMTLKEFCKIQQQDNPDFPAPQTIRDWYVSNAGGEFGSLYAQARRAQADHWADECVEIAENSSNDWMDRRCADGTISTKVNHECVQRSKLRVDVRKWLLSKLHPDVYAERFVHQTLGANGLPVDPPSAVTTIDLSAALKGWKPKGE
jgi:hypothetical protein